MIVYSSIKRSETRGSCEESLLLYSSLSGNLMKICVLIRLSICLYNYGHNLILSRKRTVRGSVRCRRYLKPTFAFPLLFLAAVFPARVPLPGRGDALLVPLFVCALRAAGLLRAAFAMITRTHRCSSRLCLNLCLFSSES